MSDLVKRLHEGIPVVDETGGGYDFGFDPDATEELLEEAADEIVRLQESLREATTNLMGDAVKIEEQRDIIEMLNGGETPMDDHLWAQMKKQRDDAVAKAERLQAKLPMTVDISEEK